MVFVDPSDAGRQFFNYGAGEGSLLSDLPHVLTTVSNAEEMDEIVKRLHSEYTESVQTILKKEAKKAFNLQDNKKRSILVIFDHYDDVSQLNGKGMGTDALSEIGKGENLHIILAGTQDITRSGSDKLRKRVDSCRYTLVLQDADALRYMGVRTRFTVKDELPPGRGFMVKAVQAYLTQICTPSMDGLNEDDPTEHLGELIGSIKKKYRKTAQWSYQSEDLTALNQAIIKVAATGEIEGLGSGYTISSESSSAMADLEALLAEQSKTKK